MTGVDISSLMSPTLKRTTSGLSKRSLQTGEPQVLQNTLFLLSDAEYACKDFHPVQSLNRFLYLSDGTKAAPCAFGIAYNDKP